MRHRIFQLTTMAVCLAVSALSGFSQDLGSLGKQEQGMGNLSSLAQKLHLSPEQMQKVMPILQNEIPKLQAIKGNTNLTGPQKVTEAKAVQNQSDSKLKKILSPQQFGSLQDYRAQQRARPVAGLATH